MQYTTYQKRIPRNPRSGKLTDEQKTWAAIMLNRGCTQGWVALHLGVTQQTISYHKLRGSFTFSRRKR